MSVKLVITYLVVLTSLNGVCGSDLNIAREAANVNSSSDHFNGTEVSSFDNEYYRDRNYVIAREVARILLFLVAVAGVCGNVVVLVVWCAETTYNPTVFLIKCLAVSDILLLILWCDFSVGLFRLPVHLLYYFRMVTAHTTLGVVVTRWAAVHKPLRAHSLLTKRRVVVGYVLMLVWCLIPVIFVTFYLLGNPGRSDVVVITNIVESMYLALPILLLVALNVSLVLKLRSLIRNSSLGEQQQQQQQQTPSQQQQQQQSQQQQLQQPMAHLQYLVKAVLCVSISTVLAYPVGIVYRALLHATVCDAECRGFWVHVSLLLEAVNSSVNIIYYLLFAPRFRQRCRHRCRCCRCCQSEDGPERQSDAMQMTVLSGVQ